MYAGAHKIAILLSLLDAGILNVGFVHLDQVKLPLVSKGFCSHGKGAALSNKPTTKLQVASIHIGSRMPTFRAALAAQNEISSNEMDSNQTDEMRC